VLRKYNKSVLLSSISPCAHFAMEVLYTRLHLLLLGYPILIVSVAEMQQFQLLPLFFCRFARVQPAVTSQVPVKVRTDGSTVLHRCKNQKWT